MFWIIVLLEVPLILSNLQTFNALLHSLLQNLTILHCIHVPLHLYQLPHPIPAHTPPNHQVITPSMFDSWCDGPVCYWLLRMGRGEVLAYVSGEVCKLRTRLGVGLGFSLCAAPSKSCSNPTF